MRVGTPSNAIDYIRITGLRPSLRRLKIRVCLRSSFGFRFDLFGHGCAEGSFDSNIKVGASILGSVGWVGWT